jgi:hypothetical protein
MKCATSKPSTSDAAATGQALKTSGRREKLGKGKLIWPCILLYEKGPKGRFGAGVTTANDIALLSKHTDDIMRGHRSEENLPVEDISGAEIRCMVVMLVFSLMIVSYEEGEGSRTQIFNVSNRLIDWTEFNLTICIAQLQNFLRKSPIVNWYYDNALPSPPQYHVRQVMPWKW